MNKLKPWMLGPLELLRHAEGHLRAGTDFDKRMALISYDNAIEVVITTYLELHPSQRQGKTYQKEDRNKWLRNYHTRLDFFDLYLAQTARKIEIPRDEIIYYHEIRNQLYHGGDGLVPREDQVLGIRKVALWIFSALFQINADDVLSEDVPFPNPLYASQKEAIPAEISFLDSYFELRNELNSLMQALGIKDPNSISPIDLKQAFYSILTEYGDLPGNYETTVDRAAETKDRIIAGESVEHSDDLGAISKGLDEISETVESKLETFRRNAVEDAVAATIVALSSEENRRVGIVSQPQGTGRPATIIQYLECLLQRIQSRNLSILVLSDRRQKSKDQFHLFKSHDNLSHSVIEATNTAHLSDLLNDSSSWIIFSTIQMVVQLKTQFTDKGPLLVIIDDINTSSYLSRLHSTLPDAAYILFSSSSIAFDNEQSKSMTTLFGYTIGNYTIQQGIQDGYLVSVSIESRKFEIEGAESVDFASRYVSNSLDKRDFEDRWHQLQNYFRSSIRVKVIAQDMVNHFYNHLQTVGGKGLVVTNDRATAEALYHEITKLKPEWQEQGTVKIVSGTLQSEEVESLLSQFRNPTNPFSLAITAGMWLTGINAPSLNILYIDKPLRGHTLAQVIGQINRKYPGKESVSIVDYVGITDNLSRWFPHSQTI